jgi:hypothetical protein
MEIKQMMELLLARINASMKEHMQEMKADQEDLNRMMKQMDAKMDDNQAKADGKRGNAGQNAR